MATIVDLILEQRQMADEERASVITVTRERFDAALAAEPGFSVEDWEALKLDVKTYTDTTYADIVCDGRTYTFTLSAEGNWVIWRKNDRLMGFSDVPKGTSGSPAWNPGWPTTGRRYAGSSLSYSMTAVESRGRLRALITRYLIKNR